MIIRIADYEIEPSDAGAWLVASYPPDTVRFYDYAGHENLEPARSPTDRVTLEDLGRLVCIGASLTFVRGHKLMARTPDARWPEDNLSSLADRTEVGDEFYEHPDIAAIVALFESWANMKDLSYGSVGKLLHIKWPRLMPIVDREFRGIYRRRAVDEHNASDMIKSTVGTRRRKRSRANIRAYLKAFRDDLVRSADALETLRDDLDGRPDPADRGSAVGHVARVRDLTDVRLLDALTWGLATSADLPRRQVDPQ